MPPRWAILSRRDQQTRSAGTNSGYFEAVIQVLSVNLEFASRGFILEFFQQCKSLAILAGCIQPFGAPY